MLKYLDARIVICRLPLLIGAVSMALVTSGCSLFGARTQVQVPELLTPLHQSKKETLIQEINRLASVKSIHGKVDITFEDNSFASVGIAEKYRQVDGNLYLQRPGKIYLALQFTIVDIAQMASDGQRFAVAVLQGDEKYKRFVKGTNSAVYPRLENAEKTVSSKKDKKKAEKETVSALSNLRPQHLTDAFMILPIDQANGHLYSLSEFYLEERDVRAQAKKGARVMRGYYLLEELSQPKEGETQVLRRFWFDRVEKIRLARVQTLDAKGQIITDVAYFIDRPIGSENAITMPSRIELTRPQDQYKISLSYQDPASVELNKEYRPEAFVLLNKWQLPEIDLDAQNNKKVIANH